MPSALPPRAPSPTARPASRSTSLLTTPARGLAASLALAASFALAALLVACGPGEPPSAAGGPVAMRRLTEAQVRNTLADVFGPEIEVVGRFEPGTRRGGLLAIGAAEASVTPSGLEQLEAMARHVAAQVVSEAHRDRLVPCRPVDPNGPDDACSEAFLRRIGPRLLRRPLEPRDVTPRVAAAAAAAERMGDFHAGLEVIVTSLLVSPDYLFRVEEVRVEEDRPDPENPGRLLLTDASLASRVAFLLWNSGPDERLLAAAARGELGRPEGLAREVDRMLASPRLAEGVRAFFEDVFRFDGFESISKDPIRYPAFSRELAEDAREQTLRVVVDHLVTRREDYRALFTTRRSTLTRRLGPVYERPVRAQRGWEPVEFAPGDRRSGILTHVSFNMLNAHPGRSSATLRGVFLREALLCQEVPPAPADVDFGLFNQDDSPEYRTARERLAVHATAVGCRNCHALSDPIGLGLEHFDGIGRFRTTENGAPIDASGELDGEAFADAASLGEAFAESPLVGACLVEHVYRYAVGREPVNAERRLLRHLERRFEASGHRLDALLRDVVLSEGFRTATPPRPERDARPEVEVETTEAIQEVEVREGGGGSDGVVPAAPPRLAHRAGAPRYAEGRP